MLITGGSRGIGRACVDTFANAGWQVAFTYQRNEQAARAIERALPGTLAIQASMESAAQIESAAEQVRVRWGKLNAVVCNAGIAEQKMFCDLTDEDWLHMLDCNLLGAVRTVRAVLPDLVAQKAGSIVLVSSIWGQTGASCESHYAASKAALIGLAKSLALELGPSGIRVNAVAPGVIDTDMNAMHDEQTRRELCQQTPLGRLGTADEVAQSIRYLCSDGASFVTGQVLGVTGGF